MDITKFNFDGLDESVMVVDPEHGPCFQSNTFLKWLGWSNPSVVREDHLRPGDEVTVVISTKRGSGFAKVGVNHLTKRGVRRMLMRSNHPRAIAYADRVLDLLDDYANNGYVVDRDNITADQAETAYRELRSISVAKRLEETGRMAIAVNISNSPNKSRLYSNISMLVNQCATGLSRQEIKQRLREAGVKNFREAASADELRRITALTQMYVASLELYVSIDADIKDIYAHAKRVCHGYANSQLVSSNADIVH